jgi:hypothetical protein
MGLPRRGTGTAITNSAEVVLALRAAIRKSVDGLYAFAEPLR